MYIYTRNQLYAYISVKTSVKTSVETSVKMSEKTSEENVGENVGGNRNRRLEMKRKIHFDGS